MEESIHNQLKETPNSGSSTALRENMLHYSPYYISVHSYKHIIYSFQAVNRKERNVTLQGPTDRRTTWQSNPNIGKV